MMILCSCRMLWWSALVALWLWCPWRLWLCYSFRMKWMQVLRKMTMTSEKMFLWWSIPCPWW